MTQDELREYRWRDIATVFQSSMNALNPVVRIEGQFRDVIEYHTEMRGDAVTERVKTLFEMVLIDHKFINAYPHELSGGMKQRINLALALAIEPRLVVLDEPTTGLDVVVQHEILENVRRLQRELGFAVLFISHDIGTVLDLSDRILVMYGGKIVEEQPAEQLLRDPMHPYSEGPARLVRRPAGRDRPHHLRPWPATGPVHPRRRAARSRHGARSGSTRAARSCRRWSSWAAAGSPATSPGSSVQADADGGGARPDPAHVRRSTVREVGRASPEPPSAGSSCSRSRTCPRPSSSAQGTEDDPDRSGEATPASCCTRAV